MPMHAASCEPTQVIHDMYGVHTDATRTSWHSMCKCLNRMQTALDIEAKYEARHLQIGHMSACDIGQLFNFICSVIAIHSREMCNSLVLQSFAIVMKICETL